MLACYWTTEESNLPTPEIRHLTSRTQRMSSVLEDTELESYTTAALATNAVCLQPQGIHSQGQVEEILLGFIHPIFYKLLPPEIPGRGFCLFSLRLLDDWKALPLKQLNAQ